MRPSAAAASRSRSGRTVAVHPQSHRRVGMAQAPRDRPHVVATGDQLGGGEVTKRMEMRVHASSLGDARHELRHNVRPDRLGTHRRPREDESVGWHLEVKLSCQLVDLGSVLAQDLEGNLVDSDAPGLVGLRGLLSPAATFGFVDTPFDGQNSGLPVHIAPAQCAQLSSTCPVRRADEEQCSEHGFDLLGLSDECLDLCDVGSLDLFCVNRRRARLAGNVVINHAPPLTLGQHCADDGMETSHCQWFVPPSRQLGIESVELPGRELREAHLSEFGSHDSVGELVVLCARSSGNGRHRLAVVQPEVEEGPHCLLPGAHLPGRDVGNQLGKLTIRESRSRPRACARTRAPSC